MKQQTAKLIATSTKIEAAFRLDRRDFFVNLICRASHSHGTALQE
jgi:hypothetical protein